MQFILYVLFTDGKDYRVQIPADIVDEVMEAIQNGKIYYKDKIACGINLEQVRYLQLVPQVEDGDKREDGTGQEETKDQESSENSNP